MAEEYVLIDDIIKNHTERMMSLRKYYPFFMITDGSLSQFKGGEYKDLDMGYLVLAVLRFFINENSFNDKPVTYKEYESFLRGILRSAFKLEGNLDELIRYIFDKIRNSGRAFEMPFFDPVEREMKIARVRFIDSIVKEEDVVYTITEEGIEFYLSTKEVKDESTITTEQLLLEKLIRSENFRGSIDVIERINIEVSQLEQKRREVMKLLLTDVHAGSKAVDEYMDRTSVWFSEERKSFAKNRELVDKAVKKATYSGGSDTIRDVNRLSNMLKLTIENHSMLIAATAELSRFSDEMIRRNRTRSLKNAFDFEGLLRRLMDADRPELMSGVVSPFLQIRREKSLPISIIDNVATSVTDDGLRGEKKEERHFLDAWLREQEKELQEKRDASDAYVRLARASLESYILKKKRLALPEGLPEEMIGQRAGAFVSIHKHGKLRGCIGTFLPVTNSVAEEILRNAVSAATEDPRFDPITPEELPWLDISVDVLGRPERVESAADLDPKKYGVIVSSGRKRGLLLPDLDGVDTVEDQIAICRQKGGIGKHENVTLERFEVIRHH